MLLEWETGEVTVECERVMCDEGAVRLFLDGPTGKRNLQVLLALEIMGIAPPDLTLDLMRRIFRRIKNAEIRCGDHTYNEQLQVIAGNGPLLHNGLGPLRCELRAQAAGAICEAICCRLNPGLYLETGARSTLLRLTPLEYYAMLGPCVGDKVSHNPANPRLPQPVLYAHSTHTFFTLRAVECVLGTVPQTAYQEKAGLRFWQCAMDANAGINGFRYALHLYFLLHAMFKIVS